MTAEELLAAMAEPLAEDGTYCTIDPETRVITIPPEYQLLGVESDEKAERIYFKCPKIVGDDIDLSKLALRVNFRNAGQVVDQYLVDDVAVDGDNITFSWLLSRRVTQYEGDVNFIVCAVRVSGETITNEWNTTLATAQVFEGLEAEVVLPEEETDIVNQLLALAETRLNDVRDATSAANTAASNANQKAQEAENAAEDARAVTEQITKDSYLHTALETFVNEVTAKPTAYGNAIVKKIEGFIRQETTTGAQLFDISRASLAGGNVKYKIINDNTIEITGGKSEQNVYSKVNFSMDNVKSLIQGKKIYLYCKFTGDHKPQGQLTITPTSGSTTYKSVWSNSWAEVDIPSDCKNIVFGLYPTTETGTTETVTFSDIKIGLTQFETWEPYTGGQPAPNPDYSMVVQGNGKYGFWDGKFENGVYNSATGKPESGTNHIRCLNDIVYPLKSGDKIKFIYEKPVNIGILLFDKQGVLTYASSSKLAEWEYTVTKDQERFRFYILDRDGVNTETAKHLTITINDKYAIAVKSKSVNLKPPTTVFLWNCEQSFYGDTDVIKSTLASTVTGEVSYGQYRIGEYRELAGKTIYVKRNGSLVNQTIYTVTGDHTVKQVVNPSSTGKYTIPTGIDADHVDILLYTAIGKTTELERMCVSFSPDVDYVPYYDNTTYIPVDYPLFEGDKIIQRNREYKLIRKWGFKTYDGSDDENWNIIYNEENNVYNIYIADMKNDGKRGLLVPNNYFYNNEYGYALHSSYISSSGNYNIIISPDMNIDTVQEWKDWLKTHTMYCVYELATPTEEPLSPEAQKALHSIMATDEQTELTIVGIPTDAGIQNQFLLPRNEDGALNTTAYCTAEKNKIVLNELVAQNLDARVNKLEIDNTTLAEQTIIVE